MQTPSSRRYDLDWLRVILILTVFAFHCTRFFDTETWHVKNPVTYPFADVAIAFVGSWHLNFTTPFLRYANEAVLPFYVLHQSVILTVGFYVVRWPIPDVAKFMTIAIGSFTIIMLLYEFLIRRVRVLRFLFGMRPLPKRAMPAGAPTRAPGRVVGA